MTNTDDNRRIWCVVSIYGNGQRRVEGRWLSKGAAESLAEDIRLYREKRPVESKPRLVVEDCSCTKLPKPSGPPPFYNPQLAWMTAFYPSYEGDDGDE